MSINTRVRGTSEVFVGDDKLFSSKKEKTARAWRHFAVFKFLKSNVVRIGRERIVRCPELIV